MYFNFITEEMFNILTFLSRTAVTRHQLSADQLGEGEERQERVVITGKLNYRSSKAKGRKYKGSVFKGKGATIKGGCKKRYILHSVRGHKKRNVKHSSST